MLAPKGNVIQGMKIFRLRVALPTTYRLSELYLLCCHCHPFQPLILERKRWCNIYAVD